MVFGRAGQADDVILNISVKMVPFNVSFEILPEKSWAGCGKSGCAKPQIIGIVRVEGKTNDGAASELRGEKVCRFVKLPPTSMFQRRTLPSKPAA